ncbi:hypothetical protein SBA5_50092 [Candidatus Sulfotelmatomonas gaucii]|uniref:Uncharacterized protein n=1 Tax=Candidatus Sulfuritelmatomonas gaucii TaxID=2043161 RepID=A0A2N9LQZ9_9BACT|nr:hypothetical protein SBA5_50092 [Candidatus Sulfotelmatomonas gaucii]
MQVQTFLEVVGIVIHPSHAVEGSSLTLDVASGLRQIESLLIRAVRIIVRGFGSAAVRDSDEGGGLEGRVVCGTGQGERLVVGVEGLLFFGDDEIEVAQLDQRRRFVFGVMRCVRGTEGGLEMIELLLRFGAQCGHGGFSGGRSLRGAAGKAKEGIRRGEECDRGAKSGENGSVAQGPAPGLKDHATWIAFIVGQKTGSREQGWGDHVLETHPSHKARKGGASRSKLRE